MTESEREFLSLAIKEARKCKPEDQRVHPLVGVVVAKDEKVLASGYRGEFDPGEHGEYTVLERKLGNETLVGATVYTTLEPCTTRKHPKVSCADRLIERKIGRLVIGMLDPNPAIRGSGQRRLREANIVTEFFPADLMAEVEEMNREFTRYQWRQQEGEFANTEFLQKYQGRRLDEWYIKINSIYWSHNFGRDAAAILAHFIEIIGGLSCVASGKKRPGIESELYVAKALAWWMALCGRLGVRSVEEMVWDKFPYRCPYCQQEKHDPDVCMEKKRGQPGPQWDVLAEFGKTRERPLRLREWQLMFSTIYPAHQTNSFAATFARLAEELGELAEAVRIFEAQPGYFLSEAADVFAWLMHLQNLIDRDKETTKEKRGSSLEVALCRSYPDSCSDCGKKICGCPPFLASTIGRIAHGVPSGRDSFGESGRFMTPERVSRLFGGQAGK